MSHKASTASNTPRCANSSSNKKQHKNSPRLGLSEHPKDSSLKVLVVEGSRGDMRVFTVNASTHINVKYIQLRAIHYIGNPKQYFCWHFVLHPSTDAKQRSGGHCGRRHTDLNFTTSPLTTPQQLFCIHLSPTGSLSHTPVCTDTNASTQTQAHIHTQNIQTQDVRSTLIFTSLSAHS